MNYGKLWGISVSPGDPEWMTLKGLNRFRSTSVIAMPQNRKGEPGMAYRIVKQYLELHQKLVPLYLPFVVDRGILTQAWNDAVSEILPFLKDGLDVAFISEGDVSFFSTFSYIAQTLNQREPEISIEAIPGVCSPLAAAAALKTPLSIWDEKVAILPALHNLDELENVLDWTEVLILMKVGSVFGKVWTILEKKNLLDRSSLVEWVGWDTQKVFENIQNLKDYQPPYFSILIVRKTDYSFRDKKS
ncbi:MAG: precorrin-2 C(20)-methyltransferase [Cyanobacteria bacterium SID2]|nr:precorrin-2 C(20)-methyltransferase [Cyanobacteria bacterium SID2]